MVSFLDELVSAEQFGMSSRESSVSFSFRLARELLWPLDCPSLRLLLVVIQSFSLVNQRCF